MLIFVFFQFLATQPFVSFPFRIRSNTTHLHHLLVNVYACTAFVDNFYPRILLLEHVSALPDISTEGRMNKVSPLRASCNTLASVTRATIGGS